MQARAISAPYDFPSFGGGCFDLPFIMIWIWVEIVPKVFNIIRGMWDFYSPHFRVWNANRRQALLMLARIV